MLSGEAFGPSAAGFVRLSLTVDEARLTAASQRLAQTATAARAEAASLSTVQ